MEKQFIIQVTCDAQTRFLWSDPELRENIEGFVRACIRKSTAGSEPQVTVMDISGLDLVMSPRVPRT